MIRYTLTLPVLILSLLLPPLATAQSEVRERIGDWLVGIRVDELTGRRTVTTISNGLLGDDRNVIGFLCTSATRRPEPYVARQYYSSDDNEFVRVRFDQGPVEGPFVYRDGPLGVLSNQLEWFVARAAKSQKVVIRSVVQSENPDSGTWVVSLRGFNAAFARLPCSKATRTN